MGPHGTLGYKAGRREGVKAWLGRDRDRGRGRGGRGGRDRSASVGGCWAWGASGEEMQSKIEKIDFL